MQNIYKIFLGLFIICIGISTYAIDWKLGFWSEENTKYLFSISAGILGVILTFVLNTWSKVGKNK